MKDPLFSALTAALVCADTGIVCAEAGVLPRIGGRAVDVRTELPGEVDSIDHDDGVTLLFEGRAVRVRFEDVVADGPRPASIW